MLRKHTDTNILHITPLTSQWFCPAAEANKELAAGCWLAGGRVPRCVIDLLSA